jgi:hypothetical protein
VTFAVCFFYSGVPIYIAEQIQLMLLISRMLCVYLLFYLLHASNELNDVVSYSSLYEIRLVLQSNPTLIEMT